MLSKKVNVALFSNILSGLSRSSKDINNCDATKKMDELEASMKHVSKIVKEDIMSVLRDIKEDVAVKINATEEFFVSKCEQLERENINLRNQMKLIYRVDILISGLTKTSVEELHNIVFKMGEILNVKLNLSRL